MKGSEELMAPSAMARLMASSAVTKVCAARLWQSMQSITRRSPWAARR
jgi:hypothetical protein